MEKPILSVQNLHKNFGSLEVLKGISFDMHKGEKIVILGPSGSGKSTILRCINQLETFSDGSIEFNGAPVTNKKNLYKLREKVGMVFQRFNVFTHQTVLQNIIEAPVHVKKIKKDDAAARAKELLKIVGLSGRENDKARYLSGGQQQRVAIARALAMEPDILLFDEPTSALDPELVGEVLNVMRDVARSGMSMIVVTHEMGFAREIADRILFIDEGVIIEDKSPEEFFTNAQHSRVKQFISKITPNTAGAANAI